MIKKTLVLIIAFYFLTLLQTSFFPHFSVKGYFFNLVLIAVLLISLFSKEHDYSIIIIALTAGFFLDIFSSQIIGPWMAILTASAVFIKLIIKKHIRLDLLNIKALESKKL